MGAQEIIIIVLVVALLFGASRLPLLGRNVGEGIKEFKRGLGEAGKNSAKPDSRPAASSEDPGGKPQR